MSPDSSHKINSKEIRCVGIGGVSKDQLLAQLQEAHVHLNDAAKVLFGSELFTVSHEHRYLNTVELTVNDLGFSRGATMPEIQAQAMNLGLRLPPLELGPHMRLQYLDQAEGSLGYEATKNRAPPGAITIASLPVCDDHDFPKGFYLRCIEGVLWLRGYRDDLEHIYDSTDRLIFITL